MRSVIVSCPASQTVSQPLTTTGTMIQSSMPHVALNPVRYLLMRRRIQINNAKAPNNGVVTMICSELSSCDLPQETSEYFLVAEEVSTSTSQ